jgi:hypothetical protein
MTVSGRVGSLGAQQLFGLTIQPVKIGLDLAQDGLVLRNGALRSADWVRAVSRVSGLRSSWLASRTKSRSPSGAASTVLRAAARAG